MKILHVTSSLDGGGIASLLMNYCSRMIPEFQFDFVITSETEGMLESKLKELGCNVYHIPQLHKAPFEHIKYLREIIKREKYDAIHEHSDYKSFFSIIIAFFCGVKIRITHSHLAFVPERKITKLERFIFTKLVKIFSTHLMACSRDAAIWMWGEDSFKNNQIKIMSNAIDTKKFLYDKEKSEILRKKYHLENSFVIGNVARFTYQKKHEFLIDIFYEILQKRTDAILFCIGDGELKKEILKKIEDLKISDKVILIGTVDNVNEYLNVMDVFVLPSRFEGLGIVYIEGQANGLKCFATDKVVPKEANICKNIEYISENATAKQWADKILEENLFRKEEVFEIICKSGYDIDKAAKDLKEYYKSL